MRIRAANRPASEFSRIRLLLIPCRFKHKPKLHGTPASSAGRAGCGWRITRKKRSRLFMRVPDEPETSGIRMDVTSDNRYKTDSSPGDGTPTGRSGTSYSADCTMHHRHPNLPRIAAFLGLILLSLSGCRYDGSFMNMDSNSGSPFFGLQLAVDSGTRPPVKNQPARDDHRPTSSPRRYPSIPDHSESASVSASQPVLLTRSAATKPRSFERTSDARELTTNVRYSLQAPITDQSLQTQAIDLRLSAF